jgi:predicted neutral ceramidase superfamily lipid hydrolase
MSRKTVAIVAAFAVLLIGVALDAWFELNGLRQPAWLLFTPSLLALLCMFYWLHYDGIEHNYRRSALLNIGIVVAGFIFVPWYLFRSRAPGARLRSIGGFFGLLLGFLVAAVIVQMVTAVALGRATAP